MVNIKQVIFSFILPFTMLVIFPFLILWLGEARSFYTLFNPNLLFLIFSIFILGIGLVLWLYCVILFYKIGKGTLFPVLGMETKSLVIAGPYKYVRNPMIIGVIITMVGEAFFFGSWWIIILSLCFFLTNAIYNPLSEEKGLEKRFGEEYIFYKKNVRAWVPKIRPYKVR